MPWKTNKRLISQGFPDLQYVPKERCGWDCTLASLAYAARMPMDGRWPDLTAWAARHGLRTSARYRELGDDALVLWHGTSSVRADKIIEHGLFHKKGLWTTTDPMISHGFCRGRSERFGVEGAVVCLVLDRSELVEGRDYEGGGDRAGAVFCFHHGLPPDVVEYVLLHDRILSAGEGTARRPAAWPSARFKKQSGTWVPVQKTPVRYSDSASYSSVEDFIGICMSRLLAELPEVTALEVFSTLYALVHPWDALRHEDVLDLISEMCVPARHRGKFQTYRAR